LSWIRHESFIAFAAATVTECIVTAEFVAKAGGWYAYKLCIRLIGGHVQKWLNELTLSEYYSSFVENGFDDMTVVKEMNEKDLTDMGISKPGHRKKIVMSIEKMKSGSSSIPPTSNTSPIQKINTNVPHIRHHSYTFNTDTKSPVLIVSNGGKTVGRNHGEGKSPLIVSNEEWTGNLVQFRIDEPRTWENNRTSIGILSLSAFSTIKGFTGFQNIVGRVPLSFGYAYDAQQGKRCGYLFCEGQEIPAEGYSQGDIIGFSLNPVTNEISFFKNNKMQGIPKQITGKCTEYHVGVSLATSCKVTIL